MHRRFLSQHGRKVVIAGLAILLTPLGSPAQSPTTPPVRTAEAGTPLTLMPPPDATQSLVPARLIAAARTTSGPAKLTPAQIAAVQRVNTYFNGVHTLTGSFTQIGPDGSRSTGRFALAKPGKVRFQYARPSPTEVIADGTSVAVRNRDLATQDLYPLSQTPLRYLLSPSLNLLKDVTLAAVYTEPDLVSVVVEDESKFAGKSRLMLVFGGEPLALKQWTITDGQGLDTTVSVADLAQNTKTDDSLFKIDYMRDIAR
jgi:outer membrane lipoprotein-sorting protein